MEKVIEILTENGWQPDGATKTETVRIPTTEAPLTCGGKGGGKLATFGGRQRFRRGLWFCTVGPRTVNFYTRDRQGFHQSQTSDTWLVRKYAEDANLA